MAKEIIISIIIGCLSSIGFVYSVLQIVDFFLKRKKKNKHKYDAKYKIGDMFYYEFDDPFEEKQFFIIVDKKLNKDGHWWYQYHYCDKDANSINNEPHTMSEMVLTESYKSKN